MEEKIVKLLSDLAAFNKLDATVIQLISDIFEVDADDLCTENGITYFV